MSVKRRLPRRRRDAEKKPLSQGQIVRVLAENIDTLIDSFTELHGTVREPSILHEIACLRAAIDIVKGKVKPSSSAPQRLCGSLNPQSKGGRR
jgi:hypothetical protein